MPLYEYQCEKCGHRFEAIRKVSDPLPDGCPQCGGAVHKLQSAPAFQFKGSGWYITDYARKGDAAPKSGDAPGEGAKGDSKESGRADATGTKSDSKEAAKPAAKTSPGSSSTKDSAAS